MERREEASLYRSPTDSDTFPMSDFLSSMHADIDCEGSLVCGTDGACRDVCEGDNSCCSSQGQSTDDVHIIVGII